MRPFSAKVISAYLIRQDGTEEYSDLSIFHDCKIEGDANNDGKVNEKDIKAIASYIMGTPSASFNKAAADMNNDSAISAADIVLIVNLLKASKNLNQGNK